MNILRNFAAILGFILVTINNYFAYFDRGLTSLIFFFACLAVMAVYGSVVEHFKPGILDKQINLEKYLVIYYFGSLGLFLLFAAVVWVLPEALKIIINILGEIVEMLTYVGDYFQ